MGMFHIMWNAAIPGTQELLHGFTEALQSTGLRPLNVDRNPNVNNADATLTAQVGAATIALSIEIKLSPPRSRAEVGRLAKDTAATASVLVAPYLSPPVREELARSGWSYWDATGNMLIRSADPAVWIDRVGAMRDPDPKLAERPRGLQSLKGKAASEVVVRLLAELRSPSVRELSRRTCVGLGTVSRIVDLLRSEGLLVDTKGGQILVDDQLVLAQRWTRDYSFETTFKPNRYFSLLGDDVALERLQRSDLRYALTGGRGAAMDFASRALVSPLPAVGMWLYTDDPTALERTMDLAPDRRGDILVAQCDFLAQGREGTQGTEPRLALPWRIVGDLLAAGGRLAALGEELAAVQPREIAVP